MPQPARKAEIDIHLHPKQYYALETEATEVLYGGSAGGGKSFGIRAAAILWASGIPGLQVYLFRRISDDLVKNHMEGPKGFRALLAPWVDAGFVRIVEGEISFWNGSKIYLCHCKDEKDIYKYQGAEIHVLLIDELTHWTEAMYRFLRNRVRMVGITVPEKWKGKFPRILCGSNPGNIGHLFVKATFIDGAEPMKIRQMPANEGGMRRQYIPARLEDNPSMAEDDPDYESRLEGLGSPELVKAMRWGDWNVIEGAYFPEFNTQKHVIRPILLPAHWTRARSFDWGSAKPFAAQWWAFATEDFRHPQGLIIPRGAAIMYREWYGASAPNVGLKMTAEEVAHGIMERQPPDEKIHYAVADPAIFAQDGGPSLAERMYNSGMRPPWQRADNKRVGTLGHLGGWDLVRARLKGEDYGTPQWQPMLYVFSNCVDFIRTFPALQHDSKRPEDLDSDMEDHCFSGDTIVHTDHGDFAFTDLSGKNGRVRSHDGMWHEFRSVRLVKKNAQMVLLRFSNGDEIKCTPDHQFLTKGGWMEASELAGQTILSLSLPHAKNLKVKGITCAEGTSNEKERDYIELFGKPHTAQSKPAGTFTTKMKIGPTILLGIWNVFQSLTILARAMGLSPLREHCYTSIVRERQPNSGTAAQWGVSGTVDITKRQHQPLFIRNILKRVFSAALHLRRKKAANSVQIIANRSGADTQEKMMLQGNVYIAKKHFPPTNTASKNFADMTALRQTAVCIAVTAIPPEDAYCLTVPDTGNFALANGMIVANCGDAARYLCSSRPWLSKAPAVKKILGLETMTMNEVWKLSTPKSRSNDRI